MLVRHDRCVQRLTLRSPFRQKRPTSLSAEQIGKLPLIEVEVRKQVPPAGRDMLRSWRRLGRGGCRRRLVLVDRAPHKSRPAGGTYFWQQLEIGGGTGSRTVLRPSCFRCMCLFAHLRRRLIVKRVGTISDLLEMVTTTQHAEVYDATLTPISAASRRQILRAKLITKLTVESTQYLIPRRRIRRVQCLWKRIESDVVSNYIQRCNVVF
jgi:hypothetical protein